MRVERRMVVLKDGNNIVGHVRADRILDRLVISKDIDSEYQDKEALVGIDDNIYIVPVEGRRVDIEGEIGNISAVLVDVDDMKVIAKGSENYVVEECNFLEYYMQYESASLQNSDTYNGDKDVDTANIDTNIIDESVLYEAVEESEDSTPSESDADAEDAMLLDDKKDAIYDEDTPFYDAIHGQLEDIYTRYEREEVLENAIEGSRFARIYYDEDKYYIIGEMKGDGDKVEIVCYGYPGEGGDNPPDDVKNSYEWLPLDRENLHGKGYYMMYQNAVTGDIIEN